MNHTIHIEIDRWFCLQEALYPINPVESINSTETSFGMTVLGGATSFLRILAQGLPFFVGCMENVVVNGQWVIPASPGSVQLAQAAETTNNTLHLAGVGVEMGCPRTDHCRPNPCQNGGACNDLWTFFNCSCRRPFLGDTCQFSYKAATFGHENATNSLVSVSITPQERLALSNSMDVSLFVRTREMSGLIFYMGTPPSDSVGPSYIAAELQNGKLVVVADLGDGEQLFPISGPSLNDGFNHLIQASLESKLQSSNEVVERLYFLGCSRPDRFTSENQRNVTVERLSYVVQTPASPSIILGGSSAERPAEASDVLVAARLGHADEQDTRGSQFQGSAPRHSGNDGGLSFYFG